MSGSGGQRTTWCACLKTHCLHGNCRCFKAGLLCSPSCKCSGCVNTPKKEKAEVELELLDKVGLKRTSPSVDRVVVVPPPSVGGLLARQDFSGCKCKKTKCADDRCPCVMYSYRCTFKCMCQDCANPHGLKGSDTNTAPGQGGAGGVSKVPDQVVQNNPSSNVKSNNIGDIGSMDEEPAQMEEQPIQSRDNRGSDQNKRPQTESSVQSMPPSVQ